MKYVCIALLLLVLVQFQVIKNLTAQLDKPTVYNITNGRER